MKQIYRRAKVIMYSTSIANLCVFIALLGILSAYVAMPIALVLLAILLITHYKSKKEFERFEYIGDECGRKYPDY